MTSSPGRGLLHLAAAVDQPEGHDVGLYAELARLAERGGLDFVTLDEAFARPGPDAPAVLSQVASATRRVGLVPTLSAVPVGLLAVPATIAALDRVSRGRAGWRIDPSATNEEALFPDRGGRLVDGDTLRRVDFRGSATPVNGPSAGAGSPQGRPVRVVEATDGRVRSVAARHADVALVRVASPARARAARDRLRSEAAGAGRDPDSLRVMASLLIDLGDGEHAAHPGNGGGGPRQTPRGPLYRGGPVDLADLIVSWRQEGAVDGFHLTPVEPRRDLERLVNGTVALLQHRGLFRTFYPGGTLREHLGLARPADRSAGGAA
ncbi:LLM class flavin-dependent oxidoreductase [Streptomyces hayashii]|uniref:LLM class flavin-dependent oxidoreductase n=1 Tax=Streptomyces hayashii TaxID=2839966 RepID=UPI00403D3DD0